MSHASFLPPCRSISGGEGSTPLVRTVGVRSPRAVTALPRQNRPVDCARSHSCGTRRTADADASPRQGSARLVRSTRVGTAGNGRPRSPAARRAHTTGSRTGTRAGCAATTLCRRLHHATHGPRSLPWCASGSDHHGGSARGTREQSTEGGAYGAPRAPPFTAWGHSFRETRMCAFLRDRQAGFTCGPLGTWHLTRPLHLCSNSVAAECI